MSTPPAVGDARLRELAIRECIAASCEPCARHVALDKDSPTRWLHWEGKGSVACRAQHLLALLDAPAPAPILARPEKSALDRFAAASRRAHDRYRGMLQHKADWAQCLDPECRADQAAIAELDATAPAPQEMPTIGSDLLCEHCARQFCPHAEQMHFDKDGCPACDLPAPAPAPPAQAEQDALLVADWKKVALAAAHGHNAAHEQMEAMREERAVERKRVRQIDYDYYRAHGLPVPPPAQASPTREHVEALTRYWTVSNEDGNISSMLRPSPKGEWLRRSDVLALYAPEAAPSCTCGHAPEHHGPGGCLDGWRLAGTGCPCRVPGSAAIDPSPSPTGEPR